MATYIVEVTRGMRLLSADGKDFKVQMHTRDIVRHNGCDWQIAERIPRFWDYILEVEVVLTFPELGEMKYLTCSGLSDRDSCLRDVTGLYLFCNFFWEYVCGALSRLDCESLIIKRSTSSIYDLLNEVGHVVTIEKTACFKNCTYITALKNYYKDQFLWVSVFVLFSWKKNQ